MTTLSPALPAAGEHRPVALIEDLKALGRFRSKMAQQALSVNVARMMYDKPYAFDRIALAHSSADASLQRLALQLFAHYSKDDAAAH
ncbi:hypothetical protein LRS03_11255 [Rhizobacter sp. J219]|uniref:hypothetical protein n=1 Tax=Rhizobacter sp. J219 TaxID=2898430 RepID=UPI0021516C34|nr:hypothetical protein [Rhizobacter sp. J219]MCR5883404.1 hypothetical protein [Rhizobacter sp. J219]